jgi:hypothetical protein
LPEIPWTPEIVAICFTTIVTPIPKAKPFKTGREMKFDRLPKRARPAMTKNAPVRRTAAATASLNSSGERGVVADAAAAATIAADDEVGETIANRLPPKM